MLTSVISTGCVKLRSLSGTELVDFDTIKTCGADRVTGVTFSPDGQILALHDEYKVMLWSLNGNFIKTLRPLGWIEIIEISFSPDSQRLAIADAYGTIILLSIEGTELQNFQAHKDSVISIAFSPDGQMLASASHDGTVKLWSLDGNELRTFCGDSSDSFYSSVTFSPDSQILAWASQDCVRLLSHDGIELHTFRGHTDKVNSIAFSPDGQILASASEDGTVILWNLNLDELLVRGCTWLRDYLKTNPNVSESDRHLCDGIETQK